LKATLDEFVGSAKARHAASENGHCTGHSGILYDQRGIANIGSFGSFRGLVRWPRTTRALGKRCAVRRAPVR
jgi:hypothetical protein